MALRFRFRWVPFLAALVAAAIGASMGEWQTRRALEKERIELRWSARENAPALPLDGAPGRLEELEFRRVILRGRFVPEWTIYLDNRPHKGAAGFYVLTLFQLEQDMSHVLVNRGWAPRNVADRTLVPQGALPSGTVGIEGVVRRSPGNVLQLGTADPLRPGAIVQNVDLADLETASGRALQGFVVEQVNASDDGLVRDWPRPSSGADKHRGYAFQWYGLAATALTFFFVTGFTRGSSRSSS
jgi:surfeit locus 1 family protein